MVAHDREKTLVVSPWTVLMAIRYGLGRLTVAHDDAIGLIQDHWKTVPESTRKSIWEDMEHIAATSPNKHVKQSTEAAMAWIEEM